ncbi:hypothetical protein J6590_062491 [Homalodisca vitripennis]|nr:hypothetical protein J6590_062491 [Homalodisca vitripennis]
MQLIPVGRRRHGKYDNPEESRRSCSFTYKVPDGSGKNVQVCGKTFREIFGVTPRKLQTLQLKKKQGCLVYNDTRGHKPKSHEHKVKFTENDRNLVRHHINTFPRVASLLGLEEDAMLTWTKVNVLKSLQKIQFKCKISQEKKKDLGGMIEYLQEENHKAFYRAIVDGSHEPALEEEGEEAEVDH